MGLVPLPPSTLTKLKPLCVPTCLLQNSLQNATMKGAFLGHQRKCVQQPSPRTLLGHETLNAKSREHPMVEEQRDG